MQRSAAAAGVLSAWPRAQLDNLEDKPRTAQVHGCCYFTSCFPNAGLSHFKKHGANVLNKDIVVHGIQAFHY